MLMLYVADINNDGMYVNGLNVDALCGWYALIYKNEWSNQMKLVFVLITRVGAVWISTTGEGEGGRVTPTG